MGLKEIVSFYGLQGPNKIELGYVAWARFVMTIKDKDGNEIDYSPVGSTKKDCGESSTGHTYKEEWRTTLTKAQSSQSQLVVLGKTAEYLRKQGPTPWGLIGPPKKKFTCKILIPSNSKTVAKFGAGWREFCKDNKFVEKQDLEFRFTDAIKRQVHVDVVEGN